MTIWSIHSCNVTYHQTKWNHKMVLLWFNLSIVEAVTVLVFIIRTNIINVTTTAAFNLMTTQPVSTHIFSVTSTYNIWLINRRLEERKNSSLLCFYWTNLLNVLYQQVHQMYTTAIGFNNYAIWCNTKLLDVLITRLLNYQLRVTWLQFYLTLLLVNKFTYPKSLFAVRLLVSGLWSTN